MKKTHYQQPTSSFETKCKAKQTKDGEKMNHLIRVVNDLRTNLVLDSHLKESIEMTNKKSITVLNSEITSIKRAIHTLTDVLLEEIDDMKKEYCANEVTKKTVKKQAEVYESQANHTLKEYIDDQIFKIENFILENNRKFIPNAEDIKSIVLSIADPQRAEITERKINNFNEEIAHVQKQFQKMIDYNMAIDQKIKGKFLQLENSVQDKFELHMNQINSQIHEIKIIMSDIKNDRDKQYDSYLKKFNDLNEKNQINESEHLKTSEKIEKIKNDIHLSLKESEEKNYQIIKNNAEAFQQNIDQLIINFEKSIGDLHGTNTNICGRLKEFENTIRTYFDELSSLLTEHENRASRKYNRYESALTDLARKVGITSPVYLIQEQTTKMAREKIKQTHSLLFQFGFNQQTKIYMQTNYFDSNQKFNNLKEKEFFVYHNINSLYSEADL